MRLILKALMDHPQTHKMWLLSLQKAPAALMNLMLLIVFLLLQAIVLRHKLDKEDLEQIDQDDLEEIDLKWKVAIFSMRVKSGHFARDCRSARNSGNMNKDARNTGYMSRDNGKRPIKEEDEQALVVQDGLGIYDWSYQVEEAATNFALMAFTSSPSSSSCSNSKVQSCSKQCEQSYEQLKTLFDEQREKLSKANIENIEVLDIKVEEVTEIVFDNRSSDEENSVANDRFKKGEGYHAVPLPLTRNYMPLKPDLSFAGLDDSIYKFKISETVTSLAKDEKYAHKTSTAYVEKPKEDRSSAPLIEDWETSVFTPAPIPAKIDFVKAVEYVKHVKPVESVKHLKMVHPQQTLKNKRIVNSGCSRAAERKNKTLIEAARTMLADSLLPIAFWVEVVNTACYVLNRALVRKTHNKTPYELLNDKSPRLDFMRPFDYPVTILSTLDPLGKFKGKADEGFLVGYSVTSKAFRAFNAKTKKVEENLHVRFLENKSNVVGTGPNWLFDIDSLTNSMHYILVFTGNQTNKNAGPQDTNGNARTEDNIDAGKEVSAQHYIVLPLWSSISSTYKSSDDKPADDKPKDDTGSKTVEEPVNKEDQAYRDELDRIMNQEKEASAAVDALRKDNPVTTSSTSRTFSAGGPSSPYPDAFIPANTLLHVNQDDSQITDLEETAKLQSTDIFNSAYGDDLDIYTSLDQSIVSSTNKRMAKKSSGAHTLMKPKKVSQALEDESWVEAMQEELLQFNLQKVFDPVARIEAIRIFLAFASFMGFIVYQMDVKSAFLYGTIEEEVYVSQHPGFIDPQFLNKVYKVEKALYGLHQAPRAWYKTLYTYLLQNRYRRGIIDKTLFIKKDKDDIMLVQVYVDDIIFRSTKKSLCDEFKALMHKRFQIRSIGELTFFLGLQVKQSKEGIFISQDKYVAKILKNFDFSFVKIVSTPIETQKPLVKDEVATDVNVHLYRSMIRSLTYLTASRPDIMFAVCACSRFQVTPKRSHLQAVKRIFRRLISWQCKKQTIVATSTTEAKYVAAARYCGQVLWIQNQMLDYGFNFINMKIYIDNERTISIIKNPVYHSKTKHIEIRHHFIRDSYEKKLIHVLKIHTDDNVADLLTKAFGVSRKLAQVTDLDAKKPHWGTDAQTRRLEKKRKARTSQPMKRRLFKGRVETSTNKSLGEDASKQGRNDDQPVELNLTNGADTEVIVEDKGSGEKGGSIAETVSTARPDINAARPEVSIAEPETPPTTTTLFDDEDVIIADTLVKMKSQKAKEKRVAFKDANDSARPIRSITTLQPLPTIDSKDKGKSVLVEEEPEKLVKVKRMDQGLAQIESDADLAQRIYKEELAKMDVDHELAIRMTHKEEKKWIDDFVHMDSKKEEKKSVEPKSKDKKGKRMKRITNSTPKQKSSKKQKMMQKQESVKSDEEESADYEQENEKLRIFHTLLMDGTLNCFNMLVEKRYPLIKEMLEKMLNWKLEAEAESTMAFELLKFIKSQIEE
nr:hypothetical protein [Tanacetum cinerariifolium]